MKIEFGNSNAANKFVEQIKKDGMKVSIAGEEYFVNYIELQFQQPFISVVLHLHHNLKRVYPTWEHGETILKDLRQRNSSLLKFTEKAIALYVSSGDAEKYLAKYNRDGTEK